MKNAKVSPFKPLPFPPRNLKRKSFAPLLQKANAALKELSLKRIKISSALLKQEAIDSLDSQTKDKNFSNEVNHYLEALAFARRKIIKAPISKKLLCEIHNILKKPSKNGYRTMQNWIGPKGCTIDQAYFYPPSPEDVGPLMDKLIKYIHTDTKEPLLQLALIFAQLLIIHPFMDGNGRIARILVPLFLYKKKLLPFPYLFLSSYFKKHRLRYFQTLYSTTDENNWEDWTVFFLKGVQQSAKKSLGEVASPRPWRRSR